MRIGLIDPSPRKKKLHNIFPHLGLGYLASCLIEKGLDVEIIDCSVASTSEMSRFLELGHDVVAISVATFHFLEAIGLSKRIKELSPSTIVVMGGPHVTLMKDEVLDQETIDYAICGEGEESFPRFLEILGNRHVPSREDLQGIPGLIYRHEQKTFINPPGLWIKDLDRLAFPAFHKWRMDRYDCYPLLTSRGCPYQCVYCSNPTIWGRRWRARSARNIVAEIEHGLQRFAIPYNWFVVVDDTFNLNMTRAESFCDLILEKNLDINWGCWGFRADRISQSLAGKMRRVGCRSVGIGIESADPEILLKMKKGETLEQITEGIQVLTRAGIQVIGQFMIGNPGDTLGSVRRSIAYAKAQPLSNIEFYLAIPYPGTALWDYVKGNGKILKEDYTRFHHFSNEPIFETREFTARERVVALQEAKKLARRRNRNTQWRRKIALIREFGLFRVLRRKRRGRS